MWWSHLLVITIGLKENKNSCRKHENRLRRGRLQGNENLQQGWRYRKQPHLYYYRKHKNFVSSI